MASTMKSIKEMKILIVDDSEDFRLLLEKILRKAGYRSLIFTESALAAFDVLGLYNKKTTQRIDIDLILMDKIMPNIDGIEAFSRIKTKQIFNDIPVIMVTVATEIASLRKAFDAGAHDYITKPPNEIELLARIRAALKLKKEIDRRKADSEELKIISLELKAANEKLKSISMTDGLTGISNRRSFDDNFKRAWGTAMRENRALSLILIDIDSFKHYNDTYGHMAGDDCLKSVAQSINTFVRRHGDIAARYGGEEFIIIMNETGLAGAAEVAEKMRKAIEKLKIPHRTSKTGKYVTISLGVSSVVPTKGSSPESLLKTSDRMLYKAKEAGRNRTEVFQEASAVKQDRAADKNP
ncbi:hypothetical protein MNBD_DELTA02-348 [hydrothermal vent metagenome]|uniref:Uncharacterized protein n=1 Tax=hydrothermal vent metagenome TaxID=652676 RepID=A0A3B0V4V2_9ZZZZ